jgi:hypothetical protein
MAHRPRLRSRSALRLAKDAAREPPSSHSRSKPRQRGRSLSLVRVSTPTDTMPFHRRKRKYRRKAVASAGVLASAVALTIIMRCRSSAMRKAGLWGELCDILERAARNGTRAHLSVEMVRALISSEAYPLLQAARVRELRALWDAEDPLLPAPEEPTARSGRDRYPDLTPDQREAVAEAASRRLHEVLAPSSGRRRRSSGGASPKLDRAAIAALTRDA